MNTRVFLTPHGRALSLRCCAINPRTTALRQLLQQPGVHPGPCCHDALSAKLIEDANFKLAFMSGFCTSAASLGLPDTGLISYAEMQQVGRTLHEATNSIPIIGDGDTGYGNAMNVKRTVRGYAAAGFAGILIEDQVAPKSCGHVRDKQVVERDDAVARIQAAVDAREEGSDILIVARTDARQAQDLDEALERAERFAAAGADILFIDALESADEMRRFSELRGAGVGTPKMASMLEGGGKTPMLSRAELANMNFKIVAYPLSLLGVSVRAMQRALVDLQEDRIPDGLVLPSFNELQGIIGFPEYFEEADKYSTKGSTASTNASSSGSPSATHSTQEEKILEASEGTEGSGSSSTYSQGRNTTNTTTNNTSTASEIFETFAQASSTGTSGTYSSTSSKSTAGTSTGGGASMGTEILEALAESASAGIGISAAVMAIAKEIEPLVKTTVASSGSSGKQNPGVRADKSTTEQQAADVVSEEEFKGAEEWYREWRKRRSGDGTTASGTADSPSGTPSSPTEETSTTSESGQNGPKGSKTESSASSSSGAPETPKTPASSPADSPSATDSEDSGKPGKTPGSMADALKRAAAAVEADAVIEPGAASTSVVTTAASREEQRRRAKMDFSNVSLRIKVVNSVTGKASLDTKLPAQWMASVADVVPQLAGADLEDVIKQIQGGNWTPSDPVAQFPSGQEITSIYIEEN